jgi:4-amino-4-deoxy-L-arabinose transferase-like glycosyltransferase
VFQGGLLLSSPLNSATPINREHATNVGLRNFVLLFCACLLFHLAGTWTLPLIDRDEPRFAEASREMLQRGDYVIPYFNNRYRFDKPPLTYWFQTLSYRAFGDNDFGARFPSTVAASLTALVIFAWGRRIGNDRLAWWAAIIFTLCLQTFVHAKAAVADMWLVLFVTAAHWAGYELLRDKLSASALQRPVRWWWIFYLSLGCAFLAKGPIGWTPLLTVLVTKRFLSDVKLNHRFLFFTGAVVTLALVAVWGIPAVSRTHGDFLRIGIGRHVVERSVIAMEGHGGASILGYIAGLPFYFIAIFITFFPWSFKLPWLARRLWRERDPLDNYFIAGSALIFLIFTLVKTKLPHYTLPAFPLLALLLAKALVRQTDSERFVRRATVVAVCLGLLAVATTPFAARFFPSFQLYRQTRHELTRDMQFGGAGYREPSLVWYFRKDIDGWFTELDDNAVPAFMAQPGRRFVVLPTDLAAALYPSTPDNWKKFTTRGFSTANFKWVDLTLLLKPM